MVTLVAIFGSSLFWSLVKMQRGRLGDQPRCRHGTVNQPLRPGCCRCYGSGNCAPAATKVASTGHILGMAAEASAGACAAARFTSEELRPGLQPKLGTEDEGRGLACRAR